MRSRSLNLLTNSTIPKGLKLVFVINESNMYSSNYWKGDSAGHAKAGRLGGKAQGWRTNPGNFKNDAEKAKKAGKKSKRKAQ